MRNATGITARAMARRLCGIAALALLAACGEGTGTSAPAAVELVERDIEAPEIFQTTETGMWDGRPSLGGVWVAHPAIRDPERVIIRNPANGAFVIGAIFKRDGADGGPDLQISADAATALGLPANSPTALNVTALRRQEAAMPILTPQSAPVADAGDTPAPIVTAPIAPADPAAAPAPAPAPAPTPAAPPAPAPASTIPASERPYIQLGIFSVEANAVSLVRSLNADGLPASAVAAQVQGKPFWRVIVGPAATTADRDRHMAQVRALGFADAYTVRN